MTRNLLIGIDLGTSSAKTVILSPEGKTLSVGSHEYPVEIPRPGWAEHTPTVWWRAVVEATRQALSRAHISPDDIAGIGVCGLMHGTVFLDSQRRPLRPAIIWADQRSQQQVAYVYRLLGREKLGQWTGNPLATGFMLSSWLWLRENEPATARATAHLLLPRDYLRYRLTSELGSEPSDAASTSLFDPASRQWSQPLLAALDIDPNLLPPVHESAEIAGGLSAEFAEASGLRAGTPVVYGGSDQACQALAHGVVEPGVVSCTIGTGGQLFAPALTPTFDPQLRLHLFCHVMPDRWHLEAATLSAGLSLKWLRDSILEGRDYQQLADLAAQVPPGCEGLFFTPYLVGERTPHMDPQARASFYGLTLGHDRAHLVRAVMEGVVFSLKQGLDLMLSLGVPAERIIASGGATNHPLWLQMQADIFDRPIYRTTNIDAVAAAAAVGAAMLAGVGVGIYPEARSAARQVVSRREEIVHPTPENTTRYAEAYAKYSRLYPGPLD